MAKVVDLGNGVYVEDVDGARLKLTTHDEADGTPSNTIWLEWETYDALLTFVATIADHYRQRRPR